MPRWVWVAAGLFVTGLVVAAALMWRGDGGEAAAPATSTSATAENPGTATEHTGTTAVPLTTVTTTEPQIIATTGAPGSDPGAAVATAHPGGNSGEVQVDWNAVPAATGYRVLRTDADGGQARIVAEIDITTGRTIGAPEVVGLWSAQHNYIPDGGPLSSTDGSPWFRYVDADEGQRCYRVQANTSAGEGPLSEVTCGSPPETAPLPSSSAPKPSY